VQDGVNGLVCDPTPESLGAAITKLLDDAALAERLGAAAFDAGSKLTWPETIGQLVQ
jgi:glycosyltransferase involved in cell wall biosynthesis